MQDDSIQRSKPDYTFWHICLILSTLSIGSIVLYDFWVTVKAAPHECAIRTGQSKTQVKAENETWFYSKVTVSSCAEPNTLFSP